MNRQKTAKQLAKFAAKLRFFSRNGPGFANLLASRTDIATSLTNAPATATLAQEIKGGGDNKGIFVYTATPSDPPAQFLEKITRNPVEFAIAHHLASLRNSGIELRSTVPIYAAAARAFKFHIFMQYLPETGLNGPLDSIRARQLAETAHTFATEAETHLRPHVALPSQNYARLSHPPFLTTLDQSTIDQTLAAIKTMPITSAHNDLHFSNLCETATGLRLIDLGSISLNLAGAEFHHFARNAQNSEAELAFFNAITDDYAEISNTAVAHIRFASYICATSRALNRSINSPAPDPFSKPAVLFQAAHKALTA